MRKITVFSLIASVLLGLFFFVPNISNAQFNYAWTKTDAKIQYCNGGECTLEQGVTAAQKSVKNNITKKPASQFIQDFIGYLLGFVSIVGVIYIIWAGFRMMTSNGDTEAMKKARTTILYVALGIVVMWLAYSIIGFIVKTLDKSDTAYKSTTRPWYAFELVPQTYAQAYTENENGTFAEYKYRIQVAAETLEAELRVNKRVSVSGLSGLKSLIQGAYERLPDGNVEAARTNESAKRLADMYIDVALKDPTSISNVGTAISQAMNFTQSVKIGKISGNISASPTTGNSPLITSFSATNIVDPSGTIPPSSNYIWWIRENGGRRRELGRWPSLTQEFTTEGNYTINLDVLSASKNSKGRTDVLPLSTSVNIQVQPKLGEITLLINGVNVSNMNEIKISPSIASQGLIFDATASRAIGNGRILETNWDFGNGNTRTYKSAPGAERQIFATSGDFPVKLEFTTNDGKKISKELTLRIKDPAATIKAERTSANAWETLSFSSETYFGSVRNVEYLWTVQNNDTGKRDTQSGDGANFSYKFSGIWSYTVTLTAKSPNGEIDSDSKTITIESREPVATLDSPQSINTERPNTFVFDASRSYDPDTNSRQGLTYTWRLNGDLVTLDELPGTSEEQKASKGTYTFENTGENTISVTVANKYGKISTAEQKFTVSSVLAGNMMISPQVAKVGQNVTFIAQSRNAKFFTWNMGDGSPQKSGNSRAVQHTFEKTGVYSVTLTLQSDDANSNTTTITRRIYISDMDSPLGIIDVTNASNSAIMEPGICDGHDAFILRRGESTTLNASNSVNTDGITGNLDYTWKFMGKVSTLSTVSETFRDLGCFPVSLTVKSKTTGASSTTTEYIKLENQKPQLTNISTTVDTNKKDSQKIIVKATANGASDPDGVITSYIWYYTTESDPEPQGLQITQQSSMTFVLPNVTEKYNFGVIIEDNDGARIDSREYLPTQVPLIIDNENSNINLPLITLHVPNNGVIKIGKSVNFSAGAKTIVGNDITSKSQYSWDFDGDGRIDEKTNTPEVSHTFTKAGDYTMRVRVTHNGVSNTKYHTLHVRNELKAAAALYKLPNGNLYALNTSQGVYDKAKWKIGNFESTNVESVVVEPSDIEKIEADGKIGTLQVSNNDSEISQVDLYDKDITAIIPNANGDIVYQSYPEAVDDVISVTDPSQVVKISLYGNTATAYAIDTDTAMDGSGDNLDGVTDNDIDNREHKSYSDGSLFTISDFSYATSRERTLKITLFDGVTPIKTKTITLRLDFLPEKTNQDNNFVNIDAALLTDFEKQELDKLAEMIRSQNDADRIILMQKYNILVENWSDTFEKAKNLVDMQRLVDERTEMSQSTKENFGKVLDALLIGDANTNNTITIATRLIKALLPPTSQNYQTMVEKIDAIASHPSDRKANKELGEELLVLIQQEPSTNLSDDHKNVIRTQLQLILANGSPSETIEPPTTPTKTSGGIMGALKTIGMIFLVIIGVIIFIFLALFVVYSLKKGDSSIGFSDFLINLFNKDKSTSAKKIETVAPKKETTEEKMERITEDPLKLFNPPEEETKTETTESLSPIDDPVMPDWLKNSENFWSTDPLANTAENNTSINASTVETEQTSDTATPDWLKSVDAPKNPDIFAAEDTGVFPSSDKKSENLSVENTSGVTGTGLPEWLQVPSADSSTDTSVPADEDRTTTAPLDNADGGMPEWLSESIQTPQTDNNISAENEKISENFSVDTGVFPSSDKNSENLSTENMENLQNPEESLQSNISSTSKFNEQTFSYTSEKTNDVGELPDWMKNLSEEATDINQTTAQRVTDNTTETTTAPLDNADGGMPEWLSESIQTPQTDNNISAENEKISENLSAEDNTTEEVTIPDWINEKHNDFLKTQDPEPNTVGVPDWIINASENSTDDILTQNKDKTEDDLTGLPASAMDDKISENLSADTGALPQSDKKSENLSKKSANKQTKAPTKSSNKKKSSAYKKKQTSPAKSPSESDNMIPDWLTGNTEAATPKTDASKKDTKTNDDQLTKSFEKKLTEDLEKKPSKKSNKKVDDSLPEWLK